MYKTQKKRKHSVHKKRFAGARDSPPGGEPDPNLTRSRAEEHVSAAKHVAAPDWFEVVLSCRAWKENSGYGSKRL